MEFIITNDRGARHDFSDHSPDDIRYLAEHFVVPNPGATATRYQDEVLKAYEVVCRVEQSYLHPRGLALKMFQRCDLAIALVKGNILLSWEMGLGKTWAGILYILCQWELGAKPNALIVTNKDLIPQWREISEQMCGGQLKVIDSTPPKNLSPDERAAWYRSQFAKMHTLAKQIKSGDQKGVWITSYYDLAQGGKRLNDIETPFVYDWNVKDDWETEQKEITPVWSLDKCPRCQATWYRDQTVCHALVHKGKWASRARCGYSPYRIKVPTYASILRNCFDTIVTDEGTALANESQQTDALRGFSARHKLLMTGTPIKNYISQAHNLLGWALGHETKRYKYAYGEEGRKSFVENYGVFEWTEDEEGRWGSGKPVGATTNTSELWKEMACNVISRRVEESGEKLPPMKFHLREAPMGFYQREQLDTWRVKFPHWFAEMNPTHKDVRSGRIWTHFIQFGIDAKFNWACVLPKGDDDFEWTKVPVSNFTPMAMQTLETTMKLLKLGRKVVVGSDTPLAVEFLAEELQSKGVKVVCLSKNGASIPPKDRAALIAKFRNGEADVLAATVGAIQMGHNLEVASAMVLHGLPWDYTSFHQFQKRIRRLTSTDPIDVFVILPGKENGTVVGRKWSVLKDKTKGIAKALYGEFDAIEEDRPDTAKILRELIANGIPATGDELKEEEVEEAWRRMPMVADVVVDDDFKNVLCKVDEMQEDDDDTEEHLDPRQYVAPFITAGDVADSLEAFFLGWRTSNERALQEQEQAIEQLEAEAEAEVNAIIAELEAQFDGLDEIQLSEPIPEEEPAVVAADLPKLPTLEETSSTDETHDADSASGGALRDPDQVGITNLSETDSEVIVEPTTGEVQPDTPPPGSPVAPEASPPVGPSPLALIKEAKELFDLGILDEAEYADAKKTLLQKLKDAA
jgi:hypothetical protein